MAFDLSTARPVDTPQAGGFDISTARPEPLAQQQPAQQPLEQPAQQSVLDELLSAGVSPEAAAREAPRLEVERATAQGRGQVAAGLPEAAATIATGVVAEPVAGLAGLGAAALNVIPGVDAGRPGDVVRGTQEALTFQPRTEAGKVSLETIGGVLEPVGRGLKAAEEALGGGTLEATGSPALAAAAATIPTVALEAVGLIGAKIAARGTKFDFPEQAKIKDQIRDITDRGFDDPGTAKLVQQLIDKLPKQSAAKEQTKALIKSGSGQKELAKLRVGEFGKLEADRLAKEAIRQGFDEAVIATAKAASKSTKRQLDRMVTILEKGKKDAKFAAKSRPSDVVGDALASRVNSVLTSNKRAGRQLDGVAKDLKGKRVDVSGPVDNFINDLSDIGIRFDPQTNRLDFEGSDVEGLAGPQNIIKRVIKRMSATRAPDAFDVHRMKRFIDEHVTFGKSAEGLSGKTEFIVKTLRRNLDQILDDAFPVYNKVNTQYADTIQSLDNFQKAIGKSIDLTSDNVDKALGTVLRRLLSNTPTRISLTDAIDDIQNVAIKYSSTGKELVKFKKADADRISKIKTAKKFDDDILTQVLFVNELDRIFGAAAATSLQGDVQKAAARAASQGIVGAAVTVAEAGFKKARRVNEQNAIKSIKKLLGE